MSGCQPETKQARQYLHLGIAIPALAVILSAAYLSLPAGILAINIPLWLALFPLAVATALAWWVSRRLFRLEIGLKTTPPSTAAVNPRSQPESAAH